jgi:hypothetical protein
LNGVTCSACSNIASNLPNAGITATQCSSCVSIKMFRTTV